ncbi:VOC family protein [Ornithinibacillus halophilus]|uniref:Glyoxalase-like domain-containing protein n=1 Tax=Ornithinibacillus halophilus TaxID=930117 RepID=A0A1M5IXK3_9BACI|nr:VOC family protein [Ornithinibacillus halophilus]SHG32670.1 Glyoxalase-like domain-containing protein [Ornithinibacillus halophilus]
MLALDHIVFAGKNAEEASQRYGSKFAIKAIKGGEHENWGTYNYLAYFSNHSYIEWMGIQNEEVAENSNNPLIQHLIHHIKNGEPGPFQIALRTDQMNDYINHFKKNNIAFKGPFEGHRIRPDGTELKWRMLFPSYDYTKEMLPFLIEWDEPIRLTGPNVASLSNPQAITDIYYGGVDKEVFAHIYQLKPRRLLKNQLTIQNTKIHFNKERLLQFHLA